MNAFDCMLCIPLLAWTLSLLGTWFLLPCLKHFNIVDKPSERSNHSTVMPRGGGLAMIAATLSCLWIAGLNPRVLCAALVLAAVSFIDDIKGLKVGIRLLAQLAAVLFALSAFPGQIFPEFIPLPLQFGVIAVAWVWFINLTNFMDGIDGITAMQTIVMMVGVCLLHAISAALPTTLALQANIVAAGAFGFYTLNRSPARVFMGDVGSIPLGFLTGYLMLRLAASGLWAAALILPAYYLCDASLTLLTRALRGEKFWQPHSQHAYQRVVRAGFSHPQVVGKITLLNLILVQLAILSAMPMVNPLIMVFAAYLFTAVLIIHFLHATAHR